MGEDYERDLERVRKARADFEATQDEVERRKQEYFTSVRTLHEAGMPLREIAGALGLSHQRVHQMVEEATGKKHAGLRRKAARAAKQGGLALLLIALGAGGFFQLTRSPEGHVEPRVSQASTPPDRHERRLMPDVGHECAIQIFRHSERWDGPGRPPAFKIKPECVLVEVRKRTS